jgi:hypothetical protein
MIQQLRQQLKNPSNNSASTNATGGGNTAKASVPSAPAQKAPEASKGRRGRPRIERPLPDPNAEKRKRGRPAKPVDPESVKPKGKRGRPKKAAVEGEVEVSNDTPPEVNVSLKRGRKPLEKPVWMDSMGTWILETLRAKNDKMTSTELIREAASVYGIRSSSDQSVMYKTVKANLNALKKSDKVFSWKEPGYEEPVFMFKPEEEA